MRALKTAAIVVGAVALVATGVGALGSAGLLGASIASGGAIAGVASAATFTTIGTLAGVAAGVGSLALAVASGNPKLLGTATAFTIDKNSGIPVVFGRTFSAGRVVHRQYYGAKNSLESWVSAHSIGPVRSLGPLLLNRVATTFIAGAASGAYAGHMWLDEQVGRCPETRALAGPQGDFPGWSAAHKLSGIAADLWTLKFDPKGKVYPNGVPQRGRVIEGVFAWDPRQDSSYAGGGSGPCRLADPDTHIYTENPWILALQWALGFFQNGVLVAGGGLPVDGIDVAAFVDAALYADMVGWKAGGVAFTDTDNSWDVLRMLAQAGGGEPVTVGGMLSCTFSSPKVAIGTITSDDICGDIDVPGTASRRARRNTVIPKVRLETHGWEMTPLDSLQSADYAAVDGGTRPMEIEFPMVQQVDQGAQLGLYAMVNGRELDGIVLPCKVYALGYRPGDCLSVDIPEAALQRDVVVRHREIEGSTMAVTLTCRSETHTKHAFCLGKTGAAPPTPDLSVPPSFPVETDRAAYLIVRQSVAYPVDSTADSITIAAFDATIDDGRTLSFPAQSIGGLDAASTYIVLWDLQTSAFVAASAPALAEVASNRYVIVRETTTANADGTYPATPTAPGGDGGGGFGSGGCPIVTARILLANATRTGPGDTIEAGRIEAGMWVWAQREGEAGSDRWGAYQVTFARTFPSPLCAVGDRPLTSPSHLWWDAGWVRSDTIGTAAGEGKVVALTIADAATYVLVDASGKWWLSHNKRAEAEAV